MEDNKLNYITAPPVESANAIIAGNQKQIVNHKRSRRKNDHLFIVLAGIIGVFVWIVFFYPGDAD